MSKSIIDGYCCDDHPPCYTQYPQGGSVGWHNCTDNKPPDGHGCEDSSNYCPSADCSNKMSWPFDVCSNCPTDAQSADPFAENYVAHNAGDEYCCDGTMQQDPCANSTGSGAPASSTSDPHVIPFHGDPYDL